MKVTALREGFYGGVLRIPGTSSAEFEIKDKSELGSWMGDEKGNPIEGAKGKTPPKSAANSGDDLAKKIEKFKADLATAKAKGDDKGVAHAAGELAKLDPDADKEALTKEAKIANLNIALKAAEDKKDEKAIESIKAELEELNPSSDLT